jgi:hypothetical protein
MYEFMEMDKHIKKAQKALGNIVFYNVQTVDGDCFLFVLLPGAICFQLTGMACINTDIQLAFDIYEFIVHASYF